MNRIAAYNTDPAANGHAAQQAIAPGIAAAGWNGLPVEIVNEETIAAAMQYDQFPSVLENSPIIAAGFRHQSALYLVTDSDSTKGFAKIYLLVPRGTMRLKSRSFGEGFTVNLAGRELALSSPVVLMTKAAWDEFRAEAE